MSSEPKKKSGKPGSNYLEEIPKDKVPASPETIQGLFFFCTARRNDISTFSSFFIPAKVFD